MKRLAAVLAVLAIAALAAFDLPPKPKSVATVRVVASCPATGDCRLIASWTLPLSWRASDSLRVNWSASSPTVIAFPRTYTRGTADTLTLPRPMEGVGYAGRVVVTSLRVGTTATSQASGSWTAPAILVPAPDSVGGLQVTPASVTVAPGGTVQYVASAS